MAFAFNEDSKKQLAWLLNRYPEKRACLLPAFRLVEEQQGFVDPEAMEYVAKELNLPPAYVVGVFTFYSDYRLPHEGKYIVQVCATLPCAVMNAQGVADAFAAEIDKHQVAVLNKMVDKGELKKEDLDKEEHRFRMGKTTADKLFTLKKVECLGSCVTAPVCKVNDDFYENLTPQKIKEIVAALIEGKVPPHMSNGPSLEGGRCSYRPIVEAFPEGK